MTALLMTALLRAARPVPLLVLLLGCFLSAMSAKAAELVMYRRPGCPYCLAFDRDIGPIYPKTALGQRVPLRHVDITSRGAAAIVLASPVRFTPTFVLVEDGHEVGRIEGYAGEDFFWGSLERLILSHQF